MENFFLFLPLIFFLGPLALGLFVGGYVERKHLADLAEREQQTSHMLVTQLKSFPDLQPGTSCIVHGEVVISSDYLKTLLSAFRRIIGGELRSFQTMLDRARREAILRLKEDAQRHGCNAICNVRLETAAIAGTGSGNKNKVMMASILASATAYHSASPAPPA